MTRSGLSRLLGLLLVAVLAEGAAQAGAKGWAGLRSPYSRDYGEGSVLAMAWLLESRGNYFLPLTEYPLVHGAYPPGFIVPLALGLRVFGPSLLPGRALAVLSTAALLALSFVLLRREGDSSARAAAWAACLLLPWFVQTWLPLARVDNLALACSFGGLLASRSGSSRGRVAALALFALAAFTKHNVLLAATAVLLDGALDPTRRRRALLDAMLLGLLVGLLFGALFALTGGEAFRHLVTYVAANDYEWDRMGEAFLQFAGLAAPALGLVLWGLARAPRELLHGPARVFVLYAALSLAGLSTIAKAGAAQNYLIEPWLALLLAAAASLRALERDASHAWPELATPAWLLSVALCASAVDRPLSRLPQALRSPERSTDFAELDQILRSTSPPVLSENLAQNILAGQPVLLDPFSFGHLARRGLADPELLVRDCERGRFRLVVAETRLSVIPRLGECLDRHYAPWKTLGPYTLLRPR